jgi:hypothetical protein
VASSRDAADWRPPDPIHRHGVRRSGHRGTDQPERPAGRILATRGRLVDPAWRLLAEFRVEGIVEDIPFDFGIVT